MAAAENFCSKAEALSVLPNDEKGGRYIMFGQLVQDRRG
jgi:hypothetical protein